MTVRLNLSIAGCALLVLSCSDSTASDDTGGEPDTIATQDAQPDSAANPDVQPDSAANPDVDDTANVLLIEEHFQTPMFFASDQLDPVAFSELGIDPSDNQAVEAYARGIRERLQAHASGAFSPRASDHVIVATSRFDGSAATRIDGRSLGEVFGDWLFMRAPNTKAIEAP